MTTQTTEIPQTVIDTLVAELVDLAEHAEQIKARTADIRAQLAKLPIGDHAGAGTPFSVRPPSRRFDAEAAFAALPDYVKPLCLGPVAAKVKAQIAPAQLDEFMVDGSGANIVTFKA